MSLSVAVRAGGPLLVVAVLLLSGGGHPRSVRAQGSAPWVAPAAEKAKKNPLPNDKKTIEQGEKLAKVNCASCHGNKGKGDGPAAVALNPKPADWTSKRVQDEPDGDLLEDHHRARSHAAVAAPPRERPLGPRPVHPYARGEVTTSEA